MPEKTFTAEHVVARSPEVVHAFLVDPDQQLEWRDRHAVELPVTEEQAPSYVRFGETLEFTLEPEGTGTLVTVRRTYSSAGVLGKIGLAFIGRGSATDELRALLSRIEMALVHDGI